MADAVIGTSYLQVVPKLDAKSLQKQAKSAGGESGSAFGASFGSVVGSASGAAGKAVKAIGVAATVAGTAAVAAMGAVTKQSVDAYARFEQLEGGVKLAFGDAYDFIEQRSTEAFRNVQLSQNDYLEQVNGLAVGLRESMGGNTKAAAELADKIITAEADIVAATGETQENVQNAFNGIMRGNFTMLDNLHLGITPTKAGMQEVIDKVNEWRVAQGKTGDLTIDSLSDCEQAVADYVEMMGMSGYAAAESAHTIEGSITSMRAAWENLLTEFGKDDANVGERMNDLVETIVGDGTEGSGVIGTVIPRVGKIVGSVVSALPEVMASAAPAISEALVGALDEATGGIASRVLAFVQPITTAVQNAVSGLSAWASANGGAMASVMDHAVGLASTIVDVLAGAIDTLTPIVGSLASAALPALSAALDFVSAGIDWTVGLVAALAEGMQPLTDAVMPVVEVIGTSLVQALQLAADTMAEADFSGFAEAVGNAMSGIVDFVETCIEHISGFCDAVANFMADPIGAIQNGFMSIVGSGEAAEGGVSSSFAAMDANVASSLSGVGSSIDVYNRTPLNDKTATTTVKGNASDGTGRSRVSDTASAIRNLSSKSVDASVTGNAKDTSLASRIWDTVSAIRNLTSKSVDVTTNYVESGTHADGGIRYHASGFIANAYGRGVPLDIVGENGAEAIIPLTNKRYTRPFADTVAEQMLVRMGGMGGTTLNVDYNAGPDVDEFARDLAITLDRLMRVGA